MSAPHESKASEKPAGGAPTLGECLHVVVCSGATEHDLRAASPLWGQLGEACGERREKALGEEIPYRGLAIAGRAIMVADVPSEGCPLASLVAASRADLAVIAVDARRGLDSGSRRCGRLLAMLGLRRMLLVVLSPDGFTLSKGRFREIELAYRDFSARSAGAEVTAIPVTVLDGTARAQQAPWYAGPGLMDVLASAPRLETAPLGRMPPVETANQFDATIVWLGDAPFLPGRDYKLQVASGIVNATVAPLRGRLDIDTLEWIAAPRLNRDEIGQCQVELGQAIPFRPFAVDREIGLFLLRDRISSSAVALGLINFALRRSRNLHWQAIDVTREARAALKGQRPCVLWFTGLSGAGKSTIANLVEKRLHAMGRHTYLLDGDNLRHGLNKDLGFTQEARVENIRRVAEVARLMADAGLIVLAAFISPFRCERRMARSLLPAGEFVEVFIDAPLAVAEARDPKGLYRKARAGQLPNFTGIDSPYEPPENAELVIDSANVPAEEAADMVVKELVRRGL